MPATRQVEQSLEKAQQSTIFHLPRSIATALGPRTVSRILQRYGSLVGMPIGND